MRAYGRGLAKALAALSCLIPAFASAADKDFSLKVEPVFVGTSPGSDIPLIIHIANAGPDAEGEVVVRAEGFQMRYPVQLPRGSKKRFTSYIHGLRDFESIDVTLDTDEGDASFRYQDPNFAGYQSHPLVMIADRAGQMSFLKINRDEEENAYRYRQSIVSDAYIKPANAPERPLAYNELPGIVLGEGSERLSDGAVRAIRTWVMLGGTVIFVGGASAPILADPRWSGILPVTGGISKSIHSASLLADLGGSPVGEAVSVTVGEPLPGAKSVREAGVPVMVTRPVGLGRAVYLAFNPFEPPVSRWTGRKKLFMNAIGVDHTTQASAWLSMQGGIGPYADYRNRYYYEEQEASGPFSMKMPPTSTIVMLLLLYFVLVVPVNLLFLRLKGKGEWAWITAPVISLGFAGIFFAFAGALYSAELSVAPKGVIVMDSPSGTGYFIGDTQIFFPRGGSYDLKVDNIEYLAAKPAIEDYYGYGRGGPERQQVETLRLMNAADVGSIKVENMAVSNLSFHEFSFAQRIQDQPFVRANLKFSLRNGRLFATGEIQNTSSYQLSNVQIIAGQFKGPLGYISPGERRKLQNVPLVPVPEQPAPDPNMPQYYREPQLSSFTGSRNVALFCDVEGYRPGPRLGKLVKEETTIRALIFLSNLMAPEAA